MTEIAGLITKELGNTFKFAIYGFFLMILIIFFLRKYKQIGSNGALQKIKLVIYYLIFPIVVGISTWFLMAVKSADKAISYTIEETVNSVEGAIYPSFHKHITANISQFLSSKDIPSNDEIVSSFLMESDESGWLKKKALHWTLVEALEYMEKKALEKTGVEIKEGDLNIAVLNQDKMILDLPFNFVKKQVKKPVKAVFTPYYTIIYVIYGLIVIILLIDIYKTRKNLTKIEIEKVDDEFLIDQTSNKID